MWRDLRTLKVTPFRHFSQLNEQQVGVVAVAVAADVSIAIATPIALHLARPNWSPQKAASRETKLYPSEDRQTDRQTAKLSLALEVNFGKSKSNFVRV